jgi:hypothetical protein
MRIYFFHVRIMDNNEPYGSVLQRHGGEPHLLKERLQCR